MVKFIFAIPTFNRFDECNNLISSVWGGTVKPDLVLVLDNSGGSYEPNDSADSPNLEIHIAEKNLGVSRSFNYFLHFVSTEYPDYYLIVSNDDLILREDTLAELERGIMENPDELIYCTGGLGLNSFSLFACDPVKLIETVGYFETAYFSYLEDLDMAYRLRLLGKDLCRVQGCEVAHHVGSATIAAYTHEEMEKFHAYRSVGTREFGKKWGNDDKVDFPTYVTPYNTGIDAVTWHKNKFTVVHPYLI